MEIPILSDAQYLVLKEKLHHAHDKLWKMIFMLPPAIREYLVKVILPQLPNVSLDLNNLILDNTSYLTSKLQPFYSDLVYLTTMIDEKGNSKPIKIALLLEHKSEMPTPLQLRIQLLQYIAAIQERNYDSKTDSTLLVIPNVFNQFDKNWKLNSFRSLFEHVSPKIAGFIPEFEVLMTNLPDFSPVLMDSFEKYGELKAGMMAMQHARNKNFLLEHFEDIFVFLERHPERESMRTQLVTYLLSASDLTPRELESLLKNVFSPILKQEVKMYGTGFIAVAARETEERVRKEEQKAAKLEMEKARLEAEKAQIAALQLQKRTLMMRGWKKGASAAFISDLTELPIEEVEKLLALFEQGKTYYMSKKRISIPKMMAITNLNEAETNVLIKILKENKGA